MIFRYSCQHSHFWYLECKFTLDLYRFTERSATLSCRIEPKESRRFGDSLELRYILGAFKHRPVSYYAFIIRWLLPSLLPGCFRFKTSFPTQRMLGNLSVRSGLFPFWLWTFAPKVCLYSRKKGIRSFFGFSKALGHLYPTSALPPFFLWYTLYLNRFRRKPAISKFDWLFTPSHKSSPPIATDVSSVLQNVLSNFQPAHD